jgi:Activator of Hsp90 ATPase homolog 1-like protein
VSARTYDASPEELGGRFQLEGNAGGDITECEPPRRLAITWELGGQASVATLDLASAGAATELTLRHALPDVDHWATYGPGAVGVGWELGLLGLAIYLRTGEPPDDREGFPTSPEGRDFMQRSASASGAAHAAAGVEPAVADEAAARTRAAYAPEPDHASS